MSVGITQEVKSHGVCCTCSCLAVSVVGGVLIIPLMPNISLYTALNHQTNTSRGLPECNCIQFCLISAMCCATVYCTQVIFPWRHINYIILALFCTWCGCSSNCMQTDQCVSWFNIISTQQLQHLNYTDQDLSSQNTSCLKWRWIVPCCESAVWIWCVLCYNVKQFAHYWLICAVIYAR